MRAGRSVWGPCAQLLALAAALSLASCSGGSSAPVAQAPSTPPTQVVQPSTGNNTSNTGGSSSASTGVASSPSGAADLTTGIKRVASQTRPAVVQITNQQVTFDRFSGNSVQVPAGVGSGVIYDRQGHILTNNHMVAGAQ